MAGEDDQHIAAVNSCLVVWLDFQVALAPMQHDVHIIHFLELADGSTLQERPWLDMKPNHTVIHAVDVHGLGDFNADRCPSKSGCGQIGRAQHSLHAHEPL